MPARKVKVVDTTAAGDAFIGGLAVALGNRYDLVDAVRYATCVGTLATMVHGAQTSLPSAEQVKAFYEQGRAQRVVMTLVGIIANPASGKDIRRLVAHAATIDNRGKVSIVRCALVGLGEAGVDQVLVMPDTDHLGERALEGLRHVHGAVPRVDLLDMPVSGQPQDSEMAAHLLSEAGAACIDSSGRRWHGAGGLQGGGRRASVTYLDGYQQRAS